MVEMKDSGLRWVGKIPNHWNVKRIKFLANDEENSFVDGDWIESPCITNSGIRYYTSGNVGDGEFKEQGDGYITEETFDVLNCKFAYPGDLVFSRLNAPYGRSCILPDTEPCCVLAVDNVILRTDQNKKFITYVTQCEGYHLEADVQAVGTAMRRISRTNLGKIKLPIPPLEEQQQIVTYLNARCAKIDGAVAQRKTIIEKLKEYKSAVITKAVTKGLNPDVDMKDSGIDWIGKIPKHWEYKRLKFLLKTNVNDLKIGPFGSALKGKTLPKDKGEYCIYAQANLIENTFEVTKHYVDAETFSELNSYEIYPDDMLFSMMGTIGKCKAMPHGFTKGIMDSHLLKARFSEEQIYAPYFEYFYDKDNSYAAILQLNKMAVGSIMSGLNRNILKNVMITVPPMNEQIAIVAYLDSQCAKIDEAIFKQEQLIVKLEEYRKSLIYYAVTGKIDCRKGA